MFCSQCGVELPKNAHFCPGCGVSAGAADADPVHASPAEQAAPAPAAKTPARKLALWKKVAIGVVVAIVAFVGLAMFLTSGLVTPVEAYLGALKEHNVAAAYEQTSKRFRQATSREQFEAFVNGNPALTQIKDFSIGERQFENNLGAVKGTLTVESGQQVPFEFRLSHEADEWKIMGFQLGEDQGGG